MAAQIAAIIIFLVMFFLIITEKTERYIATLSCALATIIIVFGIFMQSPSAAWETINIAEIFTVNFWYEAGSTTESSSGINWATIIFIAGMMIMVEGMSRTGFFRWLCMTIAKLVHYKTTAIFITFMILSAVLAMFIDSITVVLFLAAVTIELAQLLKFNPIPMILAEIFCANLGGSATMCGDPPNIIIGTSLGYTFADFITNTGLIAGISLVAVVFYFYFTFRKEFNGTKQTEIDPSTFPNPQEMIQNRKSFVISCVIFILAVILLVTHAQSGLTVAFIGVLITALTLMTAGKNATKILRKIDYKTLLFFIGLFVVVGGLEQTNVLEIISSWIEVISGGNFYLLTAIIIWISALASAFIDNIPFAATMVPVISALAAAEGMDLSTLAWALSMGTDIGGAATPIGASANVVGVSVAGREGYLISWKKYCKTLVPATLIVLVISTATIWLRYL